MINALMRIAESSHKRAFLRFNKFSLTGMASEVIKPTYARQGVKIDNETDLINALHFDTQRRLVNEALYNKADKFIVGGLLISAVVGLFAIKALWNNYEVLQTTSQKIVSNLSPEARARMGDKAEAVLSVVPSKLQERILQIQEERAARRAAEGGQASGKGEPAWKKDM